MNARVKPAVFMPLFATSTVEGPANHEALIEQMKAAGMVAGAWMVEEMVQRLGVLEAEALDYDMHDLAVTKGEAHELYVELSNLAEEIAGISGDLSAARFEDEDDLDAAVVHACEVAESLSGEVAILRDNAFSIYDSIDA